LEFIEHIENFRQLLFQCKKCLKDGGKIILTTPTNHRFIVGEDPTHIHCFRKSNFYNLARILEMKIKIKGIYIRIPKIEILIPSSNTIYNEVFLVTLEK
jgi:2-polyprenyl-3-methyl-5-hydroxy-6-metoxy-1,4-benzoquinol methylase